MALIKDTLKKLRIANDFTQEIVAGLMHISVPAYSKMETGKTDLNFSRLKQLAAVYCITVIQLITPPSQVLSTGILDLLQSKLLQRQQEVNILRLRLIELHQSLKLV